MRVGLICGLTALAWQCAAGEQVSVAGRVVDENALSVEGARVEVFSGEVRGSAVSDSAGVFGLQLPSAGEYRVRAEQQGFFVYEGKSVSFQAGSNQITITLNHLREFAESVNVVYSPPVIDPQQPDEQKQLTPSKSSPCRIRQRRTCAARCP
jgi:hypothetical protein